MHPDDGSQPEIWGAHRLPKALVGAAQAAARLPLRLGPAWRAGPPCGASRRPSASPGRLGRARKKT